MKKLNTNLDFFKLNDAVKAQIVRDYDGNVADYKRDLFISRIIDIVNAPREGKNKNEAGQRKLTFNDMKLMGALQRKFIEAEGFIVELSEEQIEFMYNELKDGTFIPSHAGVYSVITEAVTELLSANENSKNIVKDKENLEKKEHQRIQDLIDEAIEKREKQDSQNTK